MAYRRLYDPCGKMPPPAPRHCPRCFRHYMDAAREWVMVHECGVSMRDHYEERLRLARKSDDVGGYVVEITRCFIRDLKGEIVPAREIPAIARMLDEASCEAAKAVA